MPAVQSPQKPFSLLIKPASADCNLHCAYCFYLDRSRLYPGIRRHRMGQKILERLISSYMRTEQPQYSFGWQGGEPILMGVEFFRQVVALQQKYGKSGALVGNGLQTNGTLIDAELATLFAEYKFLLGVSLDGPEDVHDTYRLNLKQQGSYRRVIKGIEILKQHGVEFNILIAVNAVNVGRAEEIYRFLLDHELYYHQYIPIVELDPKGQPLPFTITGAQWGGFLCRIFDAWYTSDAERVSIRLFDAVLRLLVDGTRVMCTMGNDCRQYFVVEHNGDVYPCDFFVDADKKLGNILQQDWPELLHSERYHAFGLQKAQINDLCVQCPHLEICAGDCLKHRFYGPPENRDPKTLSWLCEGWKTFYDHTLERFRRLTRRVQRQRARELQRTMPAPPPESVIKGPAG